MFFSGVSRTANEFYSIYHVKESSSLWVHSPFARRVQFGLRMVIAFVLGCVLAYGTPLSDQLAQEFMIPNMSILCVQETFGLTLSNSVHITLVIVPLSIFLFVVQKIGLSYHRYWAGELLLLVSTLIIAYGCPKVIRSRSLAREDHSIVRRCQSEGSVCCSM